MSCMKKMSGLAVLTALATAAGAATVEPGILAEYYSFGSAHVFSMPDLDSLVPDGVAIVDTIDHPASTASWDGLGDGFVDNFAVRYTAWLDVPADGVYTFALGSDDGSNLYVDGDLLIDNSELHGMNRVTGTVTLSAGSHEIRVDYYDNDGKAGLELSWEGVGVSGSVSAAGLHQRPAGTSASVPRGCEDGLEAVFVRHLSPRELASGDRLLLSRDGVAVTNYVSSIAYPNVTTAWDGLPDWMTDYYTAEFTGLLFVERSDYYTFRLASDDGSALWIDGEMLIDHRGAHSYDSRTGARFLSAGLHPIRIEYTEEEGRAGLELLWSSFRFELRGFQPHELLHAGGSLDGDGDGMDDWWEECHGLDPADPSDAALDSDGDGLSNLGEFRLGTDPRSADTDGDGMPDGWEVANGLLPYLSDAAEDPDGDGLDNIGEFLAGTDPRSPDTDGDGCPDGVEVANARGNPLVADIDWASPVALGPAVSASSPVSSTGVWNVDADGVIYAGVRAGSLSWRLSVPVGGADALAVRVVQHEFFAADGDFDLSLKVDGVFVARTTVHAPYRSPADAVFFIPEVTPGEHEFRLVWNNCDVNTFLGVIDLRFLRYGGPDADGNGVADWRDARDAAGARLDGSVSASLVSPVCIEGSGLWSGALELAVDYGASNAVYSAVRTIGDRFYADVPLAPDGAAVITFADAGSAGRAQVSWTALDVFGGGYADDPLVIRTGDSLRFAAGAAYTVLKSRNGAWTAVTNLADAAAYEFAEAGGYLVKAVAPGTLGDREAYAQVNVVSSRFPCRNPAIQLEGSFELRCPGLDPANVLEHDAGLSVSAERVGDGVTLTVHACADDPRDYGLVSRLSEDGPVSDAVQATPVWFDNGTYCCVLRTYADGSKLVEVSILLGAVPEGLTVELEIFVSGVTFEDGTRTKILTADDFDENGMYSARFLKARGVTTSACHRTYLRQDGELVYNNQNY